MPAHALLPAVNRLLQQVEETSGLPVAVAQQSDLSTLATLRPATPEHQAHLIAYRDADEASSYHVAFEAALLLGRQAVLTLGASEHEADAVTEEVRMRDAERFALETAGGLFAGRALVLGNIEHIEPPNQEARDAQ